MMDFLESHEVLVSTDEPEKRFIMKKEKKGLESVFGKGACLNPAVVQRCLTDNDTPIKLGFLVLCDTLDELYHGLYDASLISAVRTSVFLGIISDSFSKTTANIRKENQ